MLRMIVASVLAGLAWLACGDCDLVAQEKKVGAATKESLPPRAMARFGTSKFRHGSRILCLAYSPNGRILAAGGGDDPVRLWDVDSGALQRSLPEAWVHAVVFSPRGSVIVTGGAFKTIRLWETATGKEVNKLDGHKSAVKALAISPDGTLLASGDAEGNVILWELLTARIVTTFKGHTDEITSLAFSADSSVLASGSGDRTIRLWDVDNGKFLRQVDAGCMVGAVAFAEGRTLVSGGDDYVLRLWNAETGKQIDTWKGHEGNVTSLQVIRDKKGTALTLVSGAHDGTIRLWSLGEKAEPKVIRRSTGDSDALALTRTGDFLATGGINNTVRMFETASLKELTPGDGHRAGVHSLALSRNGQLLVSTSLMGDFIVWEAETGKQIQSWSGKKAGETVLAISPDNDTIAVATGTEPILIWTAKERKELASLKGPAGDPTLSLVFANEGRTLVVGRRSGAVELWDLKDGKVIRDLKYNGPAYALAVSGDGALLAISGSNKVLLWNLSENREQKTFGTKDEGPETTWPAVAALAFHPDGKVLALACYDGIIRMMDAATGKELRACEGHASVAYGLAFSPDGRTLATASFDRTVRLWEAFSGQQVVVLKGHHGPGTAIAFAKDGRTFFSGSADTTLVRWDATGQGGTIPAVKLAVPELQDLWQRLASEDTPRAHEVLWRMAGGGKDAIAFMESSLYLVDPKKIDQLFEDLKSEVYKVREKATAELEKYGRWMEGRLTEAKSNPDNTLEVSRRLERLLGKLNVPGALSLNQERLRARRTMMILEQIGDADSVRVLEKLSQGAAEPALQQEAQMSLNRIQKMR